MNKIELSKEKPKSTSRHTETALSFYQDQETGGMAMTQVDPESDPIAFLKEISGVGDMELATDTFCTAATALPRPTDQKSDKYSRENLVVQTLNNQRPKDVIEARLVNQETSLYEMAMVMMQKVCKEDQTSTQVESRINLSIKLMRAHNETVDTLARYRRGGEQKMTVCHVAADKAIVNNFTGGGVSS